LEIIKKMKKIIIVGLTLIAVIITQKISAREITPLLEGWKFSKGSNELAYQPDFDDSKWKTVTIPHDWAIEGPFDMEGEGNTGKLPWKGEGWYRNELKISAESAGKTIYLIFDGIMAFPEIYINGKLAGKWDYGYNSFYLDITPFAQPGKKNTIAIHADTRQHDSRWYPGAGIYRKIQMLTVNPQHIDVWGSYVTTPIVKPSYTDVRIAHTLVNTSDKPLESLTLENIILHPDGYEVARKTSVVSLKPGRNLLTEVTITLSNPEKWDIENPAMYTVKARLINGTEVLDEYLTPFGVRTIKFTADDGFFLNDRRVQLKGVNLHHDHGPLGAAFNTRAMERQLEIMKDMGVNAIRNSHNVAAPELLELCDKMGLLVLNEVFDKYDEKGNFLEGADFEDFAHRNIRNFVVRDRNHPSIFLWSVGNEIVDVMRNENNGFYRLNTMVSYVRKYDPTRPVTLVSSDMETAALRHFDYYDVHCWNYNRRYALARQIEPNKSVIISESASTLSTRGFYELPLPKVKTDFTKSLQVSSYDLHAPFWAEISDDDFMWQEEENYIAGEFVWTGFDYLGEPTPYDNRGVVKMEMTDKEASYSSYFGIVDLVGIPKDRYYLYKSYWAPQETTVHILPHWNWDGMEGKEIPVFVYTNGDSAELFLNGVSQGFRKKIPNSKKSVERFRLMWNNVTYQPGELKAIAYKNGKIIGDKLVRTAGKPHYIKLTPDRTNIKAGIQDLSYVLVEAFDVKGNPCPLAENQIVFEIKGPGKIAGVGNGNPQSFESFKANQIKLFYGKAMLIVEGDAGKGEIKITASSKGLIEAKAVVKTE
jgi:beta-galactosidase